MCLQLASLCLRILLTTKMRMQKGVLDIKSQASTSPGLYSPVSWFSWADAADMYDQARKTPDLMKGFVNTVLGLPFEEAEAPHWQRLYERRESYRIGTVPEQGLFLTAGVDVHKDRLEVEIVAWGRSKESWSVDYLVIDGDTARPEVWQRLDAVLARDWIGQFRQGAADRVMGSCRLCHPGRSSLGAKARGRSWGRQVSCSWRQSSASRSLHRPPQPAPRSHIETGLTPWAGDTAPRSRPLPAVIQASPPGSRTSPTRSLY